MGFWQKKKKSIQDGKGSYVPSRVRGGDGKTKKLSRDRNRIGALVLNQSCCYP